VLDLNNLVLPLIINPSENINRILKIIEAKQNGLCASCRERITRDHVVISSGRPRHAIQAGLSEEECLAMR
jgi:hypothetical protein